MSALTITDVDAVRSEGSLKAPSDASGAASDQQIKSAIRTARTRMIDKITKETYEMVRLWTDVDLTDADKSDQYDAFLSAESCYAVAQLTSKLNAQQLSNTGLIQSIEIGKARQSFVSTDEIAKMAQTWIERGNRALSKYLTVPLQATTQKPDSFTSKKGTFFMGAI